jgi:hypothetical protein
VVLTRHSVGRLSSSITERGPSSSTLPLATAAGLVLDVDVPSHAAAKVSEESDRRIKAINLFFYALVASTNLSFSFSSVIF